MDVRPSSAALAAWALCRRELVRFVRQRHRVIGAFATPIVFWVLIGAGMGHSFSGGPMTAGRGDFLEFFFPGTILMILLFTAIFSTISIIEDRKEGFLQGVLVSPVPRGAVVLGMVMGATLLAFVQGLIFVLLGPLVGIHLSAAGFVATCGMMLVISFALSALGFAIAWRMTSTQGFHAIMNLFLLPLWFLSGALFPPDKSLGPMKWVIGINPLTYGLDGIRRGLYWGNPATGAALPSWTICVGVSVAFAIAMYAAASAIAAGRTKADLE